MKSDARIFVDDTSLFVVVDDPQTAFEILSHDLKLVEVWARQWHMSFNPDPAKPPIEIVFSTKTKPPNTHRCSLMVQWSNQWWSISTLDSFSIKN